MLEGSSVSQEAARCEEEEGEVQAGKNGVSLPLRSVLEARRMRRENTGRMSHDAGEAGQREGQERLDHGFITILVVGCLKRCLYPSTRRSGLSNGVAARNCSLLS